MENSEYVHRLRRKESIESEKLETQNKRRMYMPIIAPKKKEEWLLKHGGGRRRLKLAFKGGGQGDFFLLRPTVLKKAEPEARIEVLTLCCCLFSFFSPFYSHTCGLWKFLGQGSNQSCSCRPTPQSRQHHIRGTSATYAPPCGNTGSLTH